MRLLVNLESLAPPRTGIGYYTEHLVSEFLRSPEWGVEVFGLQQGRLLEADELKSLVFQSEEGAQAGAGVVKEGSRSGTLSRLRPYIRAIPGAYQTRQAILHARARRQTAKLDADLFHEPNYVAMRFNGPVVLTVHDMSHVRYPQYHPPERVAHLNRGLPGAIARADHIITVSEFTRQELLDIHPEAEGKTTAIHLGVSEDFRPRSGAETEQVLSRWGLTHGSYILSAATLEPRKNLSGLVKAFQELPPELARQYPLVLAGGKGWKNRELESLLKTLDGGDHKVILTGRVSRQDLTHLMSGARLFAYPSFYEGFGLPIAEARASGVPVLTSDRGAMREVAGVDEVLVDPSDFVDKLRDALDRPRATKPPFRYSWTTTARQTLDIYHRVLQK